MPSQQVTEFYDSAVAFCEKVVMLEYALLKNASRFVNFKSRESATFLRYNCDPKLIVSLLFEI